MADLRDTYGNPVQHTDQYGNPVPPRHTDVVGGDTAYGVGTAGHDSTAAQHGQPQHHGAGGVTGILHRSGSSSSSSSEDDGLGGRRKKKGLKEKVKEKMPGGHKTATDEYGHTHVQQPHERKGVVEKVKEKIPGGHNTATDEYGHTHVQQPHEKKGMMEKIKEKLPGTH